MPSRPFHSTSQAATIIVYQPPSQRIARYAPQRNFDRRRQLVGLIPRIFRVVTETLYQRMSPICENLQRFAKAQGSRRAHFKPLRQVVPLIAKRVPRNLIRSQPAFFPLEPPTKLFLPSIESALARPAKRISYSPRNRKRTKDPSPLLKALQSCHLTQLRIFIQQRTIPDPTSFLGEEFSQSHISSAHLSCRKET